MTVTAPIEDDLVACVNRGEMDEWQAMQVQTCRDAAYARAQCDALTKKVEELEKRQDSPAQKQPECPVRLVPRG